MYFKLLNLFRKFIRSFIVGTDEKSYGEAEEKVGIAFICAAMWLFQAIYLLAIKLPVDACIASGSFLFLIFFLFLLKYKIISIKQFSHLNIFIAIIGIWGVNMDAGMGVNPSLIWFGTLPLFAVIQTGIKSGFYWSLFSALLSFSTMILAKKFGYTYNEFNPEQWHNVATSNMIMAPLLYFATFAYIYNKKDQKIEFHQKFAEFGKSSAFVMHEIAKPINRLMQKDSNVDAEIRNIIDIYSVSESLRKNQFKDIIMTKISLLEIINSTIEKYKTYVDYYSIQIELNAVDIFIESDLKFLSIVLDNLIRNAIEACSEVKGKKYIKVTAENNELIFENSVSEKTLSSDQLFSPMQSSKPGHLGIGLYVARNLMNGLGGDLLVDEDTPKNAFQVCLKL